MLNVTQDLIKNQYEALLCTMMECIERCPDDLWNEPVVNLKYCQVVFHTLFFTDFYLERTDQTVREQPFHAEHPEIFRDYEELEDRQPVLLYEKAWLRLYVEHCRKKAAEVVRSETPESFAARCGFPRRECSQAELHVYNIRHIAHHAAQLSMRLRMQTGQGVPWIDHGWTTFR